MENPAPAGDADWIVSTSRNKTERKGEVKSTSVSNKYDLIDNVETKEKGKESGKQPSIGSVSPESVSPEPASTRLAFGSGSGFGKFCSSKLLCIFFTSVGVLGLGCSAFALSSVSSGAVSELLDSVFVHDAAALLVVNLSNPTALPVLDAATYRAMPNITPKARQPIGTASSQTKGYVILAGPRTASSTLCHRLQEHRFRCNGEMLWHGRNFAKGLNMTCPVWPLSACTEACFSDSVQTYYANCNTLRWKACGFKVFQPHLRCGTLLNQSINLNVTWLQKFVGKVVILERRNKTKQYLSLAKAFETGCWGFRNCTDGASKIPEYRQTHSMSRVIRDTENWYSALLAAYGKMGLHVYMEDYLSSEKEFNKIVTYLEK